MPSIEDNYSIDYLAHCAFATSIRSNQRDDFTCTDLQVSIRQGNHGPVALDDIASRKRLSHGFLLEIGIDNFLVCQDVIEQVSIGLAFAHLQTIGQVFAGDNSRQR